MSYGRMWQYLIALAYITLYMRDYDSIPSAVWKQTTQRLVISLDYLCLLRRSQLSAQQKQSGALGHGERLERSPAETEQIKVGRDELRGVRQLR
jgi:hypothetical protein